MRFTKIFTVGGVVSSLVIACFSPPDMDGEQQLLLRERVRVLGQQLVLDLRDRLCFPLAGRHDGIADGAIGGDTDEDAQAVHDLLASGHVVLAGFRSSLNRMRLPNGSMTSTHRAS